MEIILWSVISLAALCGSFIAGMLYGKTAVLKAANVVVGEAGKIKNGI